MKRFFLLLIIITGSLLSAVQYNVKQDGTGDFSVIQNAVDSANNGDAILVYPGTYYENIEISNKNIDLYSLRHTTGDETYVSQTVINGRDSLSCISIIENSTVLIDGFSITNGNGSYYDNKEIGGGIRILSNSIVELKNSQIYKNYAITGGGVALENATLIIANNTIKKNHSLDGGGLYLSQNVNIQMDMYNRNSIYDNHAGAGVDIYYNSIGSNNYSIFPVYLDTFTVEDPNNYFVSYTILNQQFSSDNSPFTLIDIEHGFKELIDHDLYVSVNGNNDNTGLTSDDPLKSISFALKSIVSDSLNPKTIFVAEGEYKNFDGGEEIFPLPLKSNVNIQGASNCNTIIFAKKDFGTYLTNPLYSNSTIKNLTFSSQTKFSPVMLPFKTILIENCNFENSTAVRGYPGFFCQILYDLTMRNCIIKNNITQHIQAGLTFYYGNNVFIENCLIENNVSGMANVPVGGNGFRLGLGDNLIMRNTIVRDNYVDAPVVSCMFLLSNMNSSTTPHYIMENCLFYNNSSLMYPDPYIGGLNSFGQLAIKTSSQTHDDLVEINNCSFIDNTNVSTSENPASMIALYGNTTIRNSIFSNNTDCEIMIPSNHGNNQFSYINVENCAITNGEDGIVKEWDEIHELTTENIYNTEELLFDETSEYPFYPSENSITIDNGTMDYDYPETDLAGNPRVWGDGIDIGCYEFGSTGNSNEDIVTPSRVQIQNYPNPFNPRQAKTTNIRLKLPYRSHVEVSIYNIKGQKVANILDGEFSEGEFKSNWNGRNFNNEQVASGQYFMKVITDSDCVAKKMLIVK